MIILTGADGFIGKNFLKKLEGKEVFEVEKRIRHAININETDMTFFKFKFSFKIK